jgi:hypothetical protein
MANAEHLRPGDAYLRDVAIWVLMDYWDELLIAP